MTQKEKVLSVIGHNGVNPVPFTLHMEEDVFKRVSQHYGGTDWNKELPVYIVGVSALDTNMQHAEGEGRVRDPYGAIWRTDMRPWHLEEVPLKSPSLDGYAFPGVDDFKVPGMKEHAQGVCESDQEHFLVGNLGWGLFERSWNLRGFTEVLMDYALEEDFVEEVLDRLCELYLDFVDYTADLPIDGILFGDDWGDQRGIILGPERWRKLIKPRWARIYDRTRSYGKVIMSHSCGSVCDIIPDLIDMGLDVLESVQPEARGMAPEKLKAEFGRDITFWGCLGSQSTIPFGTPTQVRDEVFRLCDVMGKGGGYIFAPAKLLQPETPTENAVAIVEALMELQRG